MHADYYRTDLGDDVQLYSAMFGSGGAVRLDRDDVERLRLALDRAIEFDESILVAFEAEYEGRVWFAPGVAWAHASCLQGHQVGVLPLTIGETPRGKVPVTVAGDTIDIAFVTEESQHVQFFRRVISLEKSDEEMFKRVAPSAFPALEWADDVWQGLKDFRRGYISVREKLTRCLGGLSDHGATCFYEHGAGDPRKLQQILSARVGCETSDENGPTKAHVPSKIDRTKRHRGRNKVFWWHMKLQPHVNRIYFRYEPPPTVPHPHERGSIVVGLFKDHCIMPN